MRRTSGIVRWLLAGSVAVALSACVGVRQGPYDSSDNGTGKNPLPFGVIVPHPTFEMAEAHAEVRVRVPGEPLEPFFSALDDLRLSKISTVNILQLGDSHTAGDRFSGHLRDLFQQKFGNAGRGMLPPGVPFDHYRPTNVTVTSAGWQSITSFTAHPVGPFGLAGFRAHATQAGALMTLEPKDGVAFDHVEIGVVLQPGGGTLIARADGLEVARASTRDANVSTGLLTLPIKSPAHHIELTVAGDGPVDLTSWTVGRNAPGITYDSQGIIGTTVTIMDHWDRPTLAWELANRHPSLIVLVYGTNEGFGDGLIAANYAADFTRELTMLHELAPTAALLVVGPPDGERLPAGCAGANSPRVRYGCAPLSTADLQNYDALFKVRHPRGKACRWYEPPNLAVVRSIQRQAAGSHRAGFWDWSQVMGTDCGLHNWTRLSPPLAALDHVHMTPDGYARGADALFDHLMQSYQAWQAAAHSPLLTGAQQTTSAQ